MSNCGVILPNQGLGWLLRRCSTAGKASDLMSTLNLNYIRVLVPDACLWPGPEVIKLFPCLNQLRTKFILLINVKMPTIVGILTFISMINTTSERLKARNVFICRYFTFY